MRPPLATAPRPRILHVMESTLGGTRRYLADVVDAWVNAENGLVYSTVRADVEFAPLLERAERAGWWLRDVPMVRSIAPHVDAWGAYLLRRAIVAFAPDVIHAHSSKAGALVRVVAPTLRPRPAIVYSPHAIASEVSSVYAMAERALAKITDRFVAVTESERAQLLRLGLAPLDRIDVANPAIDGDRFAPIPRDEAKLRLGFGDQIVVTAVGRLCDQKNPFEFLAIVRALRERRPTLAAQWVGDGELQAPLERELAASKDDDWFAVRGFRRDVRDYIAASDLVVSASKYESFGYSTAEAIAMKVPIVASNVVGTTDIMTGPLAALLYPAGNVAAAVARCDAVLERVDEYAALVASGRFDLLRKFSSVALRDRLQDAYGSAEARNRGLR